jgi:hypothetical protein
LPHLHLALKILFDQQRRAFARAQAVGINLDAVKPEAENRSRKVGLRTVWSESLVTSEKVSTPVRDRAMGSNSSMRLPTATCNFGIITAIAPAAKS